MAKLAVNSLKPGMITLSEVLDKSGHALIRPNEELSDKHITLLKMWGIVEIEVKKSRQEINYDLLLAEYPSNIVRHAIDLANERFKFFNDEDRITQLLKKCFIENTLDGANK